MAIHPDKRSALIDEMRRLLATAKANDTLLDLTSRRTPGPIADSEWTEFVTTLTERLDNRSFSLIDPSSRRLIMTRRGRSG